MANELSKFKLKGYEAEICDETARNELQSKADKSYVDGLIGDMLSKNDVVNNLTSISTDKPLSANMGRVLNSDLTVSSGADIFTPATGVSVVINNTIKNGKMVTLSLLLDCTNVTVTTSAEIIVGTVSLPPTLNNITSFAMGYSAASDGGTCMRCNVNTNNNVTLLHMAGQKYAVINVCYFI